MFAIGTAGVAAVALAALLLGAFGGSSQARHVTASKAAEVTDNDRTLTMVAGPGCDTSRAGFTAANDSSVYATGGYVGDGCHGQYLAVPVSGSASRYDSDRLTLWSFGFARRYTSCHVDTYVPNSADLARVGGAPAHYYVYDTAYSANAKATATYSVSQTTERERWVGGKTFAVRSGVVTVALLDAGVDDTAATRSAHVAAAQIRLTCHTA